MLGRVLKAVLGHPLAAQVGDINDPVSRILAHRRLIEAKPLLREGYVRWYRELLPAVAESAQLVGDIVELGSGPSFLDEFVPGLLKTDSVPNPYAHRIIDAMAMDFPDASLRAILEIGVVHHLPRPELFFREAERCLVKGGRLAMVETGHRYPLVGFPSALLQLLDHYEYRDREAPTWENDRAGNMRGANLALPWAIFDRDRALFERRFPTLRIVRVGYHTFSHHFLAGAFALRSLVPKAAVPLVFAVERALEPWMDRLGTMMTIQLERV